MENLKEKIIKFFDPKTEKELFEGSMEIAKSIAIFAHFGKFRENGEYYITHPISVSNRFCKAISLPVSEQLLPRDLVASFGVPTKGVFEVAILHDVLEDTEVTLEDIRGIYKEYGQLLAFERYIELPLTLITHDKSEDYDTYMSKVLTSEVSSLVKMFDLVDNLNVATLISLSEKEVDRCHRYINYIKLINDKYHFLETLNEIRLYALNSLEE